MVAKRDTICLSKGNAPIYVKQPLKQQKFIETYSIYSPVSNFY